MEMHLVESETPETIHIIYIHPHNITWYLFLPECLCNLHHVEKEDHTTIKFGKL